jgi:UDPglucose 6-dehydrogenase
LNYLATSNHSRYNAEPDSQISFDLEGISVFVHSDPYAAMENSHATAILTEWDEFKSYNWQEIYNNMLKPAFVFDGRNILDSGLMQKIGFKFSQIDKE